MILTEADGRSHEAMSKKTAATTSARRRSPKIPACTIRRLYRPLMHGKRLLWMSSYYASDVGPSRLVASS